MRAAVYLRVSTDRQDTANQQPDLERYLQARGWTATKWYTDSAISGSTERRPALDELVKDARRRRFDAVVVWKMDRMFRSAKHSAIMLDELRVLDVHFVSVTEGVDSSTPLGRAMMQIASVFAELERENTRERVRATLARLRASGKHIGRPRHRVRDVDLQRVAGLTVRDAAKRLGVSPALVSRLRRSQRVSDCAPGFASDSPGPTEPSTDVHKPTAL